jgi:hypothetical protein
LLVVAATTAAGGCDGANDAASFDDTRTVRHALTAPDVPWIATEILGRPTDHSITVNAIAGQGVEAYFEYGAAPGVYTNHTTQTVFPGGAIEVVIDGLTPNTRYYYRKRHRPSGSTDDFIVGAEHTFHTQRSRADTFSFAVQADSHQGFAAFFSDQLYGLTMQNIAAGQPDFVVDLGDTFSLDDATETEATVREKYLDQRAFFGVAAHSSPLFLVLGNHENEEGWNLDDFGSNRAASLPVLGGNARKRYYLNPIPDAFFTGNTDPLPELDGDHLRGDYYAFEWGNALFIALDPFAYTMRKPYAGSTGGEKNDETVGNRWDWTLGRAQYLWLKTTLERSTAPFKFVFMHHLTGGTADYSRAGARGAKYCEWGGYDTDGTTYSFATNRPGWEMPIHQLLVQNHVTTVFHAHDHVFAKEDLDGIVYQEMPFAANDDYGFGFSSNQTDYAGADMVENSGHVRVTVAPAAVTVDYVRSFLPGDGTNGSVDYTYSVTSCAARDADGDGTNDCTDACPADPGKTAPGACGCGVPDVDANNNGTADCLETCTGATLASNDADARASVGSTITWTAGAQCASATYQFRMMAPRSFTWRTVRAYATGNTYTWNTAGLATGTYRFQAQVRRTGSTGPTETSVQSTFTLTR